MPKYATGDLVELISGSPDMTVLHCDADTVWLAWCSENQDGVLGEMHRAELPVGAVRPVGRAPEPASGPREIPPFLAGYRQPVRPDFDDDIPF